MSSCCRALPFVIAFFLPLLSLSGQDPFVSVSTEGPVTRVQLVSPGGARTVHETHEPVFDAVLRDVPGSRAWAITWRERSADRGVLDRYVVSPDGRRVSAVREARYDLLLRYQVHDPLLGAPQVPAHLDTSATGRLYIVQYWTQGLEAYRDAISAGGGEILLFLANQANVVQMDARAASLVQQMPFVRSVSVFQAAYKLEEELLEEQRRGFAAKPVQRVNILTTRRGPAGQGPVAARIAALGGVVDAVSPETYLMSATVSFGAIAALARMDEVQWIDRWSPPEEDMNIARSFHGADFVQTQGGYDGTGVRGEVLDGGCDTGHPDLTSFLIHNSNTASSHGTATSGIVFGSGANNANATGAMPNGFLIIGDYSFLAGSRYNHTGELQNPALNFKAVLQSNSWGSTRTTQYTSISQDLDLILFDWSRIIICQSQSNAGNQDSRPQAWAKNIVAVGGIRHQNTATTSDDSWSGGASIGPAADGRIKPDLASFYDWILCTDRVGGAGYSSTNYTSSFGGTSGATPIVAGHIGLLYQMWSDGIFGNATPGTTVFDNRPFNTTMKALAINTATQWTFSGTGHDLTRVHQGWGHPDLQTAWNLRNEMFIVDETDVLLNLGSTIHNLTVQPGTPAFKATLVYRDNPGTTSSTQHRINNLDLRVTSPSGTLYWGNNGLNAGMWSTAGGSANTVDTVENVFVQNPQAGTWSVEVIAAELNQDNHTETGTLDADYALVVTGVDPGAGQVLAANFNGSPLTGGAPLTVSFTDLSTGNPTTWLWDFGDGATSTVQHPSHVYAAAGTFTVTLTVTASTGSDSLVRTNYVTVTVPPPVADFVGTPVSGGHPLTVTFTDQTTGVVNFWSWNFGDGNTSSLQSPSHTYTAAGTYTVSLIASGPSGTDIKVRTDYITVTEPPPVADFSGTPLAGNAPLTVSFTDLSTGVVGFWGWTFGDGGASNDQNPVHTYTAAGTYTVSLIVAGPNGTSVETKTDYVTVSAPAPVAAFSAVPTSGGAPLTVAFSDQSTGAVTSWAWTFGDGGTSTQQNPSHVYTSPGLYTVSLTVSGPGGTDTATMTDLVSVTGQSFYASFDAQVALPGVGTVEDEDIVRFDAATQSWSLYFDGSDVGLGGADVNAFHVIENVGVLLSFDATTQVPSLSGGPAGTTVESNDVVFFAPTSVGSVTSGSMVFVVDGSDVGLVDPGAGIDGMSLVLGSWLLLSVDGAANVGFLGPIPGEDMVLFIPTALGSSTAGIWFYAWNGSDLGVSGPGENLDALHFDTLARSSFSTSGSLLAGAVSAGAGDVTRFTGAYGPVSSGSLDLLVDLQALGVTANLDGVTLIP